MANMVAHGTWTHDFENKAATNVETRRHPVKHSALKHNSETLNGSYKSLMIFDCSILNYILSIAIMTRIRRQGVIVPIKCIQICN